MSMDFRLSKSFKHIQYTYSFDSDTIPNNFYASLAIKYGVILNLILPRVHNLQSSRAELIQNLLLIDAGFDNTSIMFYAWTYNGLESCPKLP